jgi:hypothetical protein
MRAMRTIGLLCGLLVSAAAVKPELNPVPGTQSTTLLFQNADLVCTAVVSSIASVSRQGGNNADTDQETRIINVRVQDYYKRVDPDRHDLRVLVHQNLSRRSSSPGEIFQPGRTFLLFLKSETGNSYSLADRFSSATLFTSITSAQNVSAATGIAKLQTVLSFILSGHNREDSLNAMRLIEGFDSIDSDTVLRVERISGSGDTEVALSAFAVLVKAGTPGRIAELSSYLDQTVDADQSISLLSVASELEHVRDSKQLKEIEHLSASKYLSIRLAAMNSLRNMKNLSSVPTLIDRLDDPDTTVRYIAIITLAEIYGKYDGDFAPSMYLFDAKPKYYSDLWKTWWIERGRKL